MLPLILGIHRLLEIRQFQYFREVFMRNILATPTATKCTIIVPRCFTMVHEHLTLETLIKILAEFLKNFLIETWYDFLPTLARTGVVN